MAQGSIALWINVDVSVQRTHRSASGPGARLAGFAIHQLKRPGLFRLPFILATIGLLVPDAARVLADVAMLAPLIVLPWDAEG